MSEQKEMIDVDTWTLYLGDYESNEPVFYYNTKLDVFERKHSNACSFWSEEECKKKDAELNIDGLQIGKGLTRMPKEYLVDTFMSVFVDLGVVGEEKKESEENYHCGICDRGVPEEETLCADCEEEEGNKE